MQEPVDTATVVASDQESQVVRLHHSHTRATRPEGVRVRKNRDNMTPGRWEHIKQLGVNPGKYVHISKEARMIENPLGAHLPWVPWTSHGVIFRKPKE